MVASLNVYFLGCPVYDTYLFLDNFFSQFVILF